MDEDAYRRAEAALWDDGRGQAAGAPGPPGRHRDDRAGAVGREGDPVLLVHGGPNAGSTFVPLVPGLLPGRRLLLVDRPGCGLSEPHRLDAGSLPAFADRFATDVLDGLGHRPGRRGGVVVRWLPRAARRRRLARPVPGHGPARLPGLRARHARAADDARAGLAAAAPDHPPRAHRALLGRVDDRRSATAPPSARAGSTPRWRPGGCRCSATRTTFVNDAALIARIVGPVRGADPSLVLDA